MPNIDISNIITVISAVFGGGVVGVIIKSFSEKKKTNAEANNINIQSLLDIDQRMNERMTKLEERVKDLEHENYELKSDKLTAERINNELEARITKLEEENHKLEERIAKLEEEKKQLSEENDSLRAELAKFQEERR